MKESAKYKYAFLIIALTALVYAGTLQGSFVGDDVNTITNNGFIKDWRNLPLLFSRQYLTSIKDLSSPGQPAAGAGEVFYRPVATFSYFVDYHLWGLRPFGYHLTNLLLHIANALLLFRLLNLISGSLAGAAAGALVFALHPVNTEAVSAVCFREDLLAFLFFFLAILFYIVSLGSSGGKRSRAYGASLAAFFLALFSKEMAATLPFILMVYDRYFPGKEKRRSFSAAFRSRYLGYFLVLAFHLLVWGAVLRNPNPLPQYPGGSFYTNILTMAKVIAGYVRWIAWPADLHFMVTDRHLAVRYFTPEAAVYFLLIAGLLAAAVKLFKYSRGISFSIAWFFITLAPVMNIIPIMHIVGLRYLYIPIAGFGIFIAFLRPAAPVLRAAGKAAVVMLLVFYAVLSMARVRVWKDNVALWSEIAGRYPDNYFAHRGLGDVFLNNGQPEKALTEYANALEIAPANAGLYYDIGELYVRLDRQREAEAAYKKAVELDPRYLEAYNNLAALYAQSGRIPEAISLWEKAVELAPRFSVAHFNLAVFYFQEKQYALAIRHCDAVARSGDKIDPAFLELLKPHRK